MFALATLTAVIATYAASAALWSAHSAHRSAIASEWTARTAEDTLRQMRQDSRNAARPYVGAQLIKGSAPTYQELIIRNFGSVEAREVKINFLPLLPTDQDDKFPLARVLRQRYQNPLPALLPGQFLSNIYYYGQGANEMPLPERFRYG